MAIKSKKGTRSTRERRKIRIRKTMWGTAEKPRLSVFKSARHTYAQAICDDRGQTLVSASTRDADVMAELRKIPEVGAKETESKKAKENEQPKKVAMSTKSVAAARAVGIVIARRAAERRIERLVFDRNGFLFSGRIKAVADGIREGGLKV